jgi:hypothetical protein
MSGSEDREMLRIQQARHFAFRTANYIDVNVTLIGIALILFAAVVNIMLQTHALSVFKHMPEIDGAAVFGLLTCLMTLKAIRYRRKFLRPEWSDVKFFLSLQFSFSALLMISGGVFVLLIAAAL